MKDQTQEVNDIKEFHLLEHKIDVEGNIPVKQWYYPMSPDEQKISMKSWMKY